MRNHSFLVLVLLLVVGVFGVDTDGVKIEVSVMEGDSVTLLTDLTEIQTDEDLKWKIQDKVIAEINEVTKNITVLGNISFEGRLTLDKTTGSLTITNIKTTDSRVYKLKISGKNLTEKEFSVSVHGVFSVDGVKKRPVKKGESVTLQTKMTDIPEDDVIEWTFGPQDTALVKTDRQKKTIIYNKDDVRFKDRLHLDTKSGDLTVKNIKPEMSGLYKVTIIKRTYTIQKIFSVTVDDPRERSGSAGTGVSVKYGSSVVLVCAAAVLLLQGV